MRPYPRTTSSPDCADPHARPAPGWPLLYGLASAPRQRGVHKGARIGPARRGAHQLAGPDFTTLTLGELIAGGPVCVVVVATNTSSDIHGNPRKMTVLELVDYVTSLSNARPRSGC